jgi:hypothetical protein
VAVANDSWESVAQELNQADSWESVAQELQPERPSTFVSTAARVAPALIGAGVGSVVPGVGTAVGGAVGAGLGEGFAQYLEGEFKPAQIPLSVLLGLIPGLKIGQGLGTAARVGIRAGEGAVMGAGGTVASRAVEGELPSWEEVAKSMAMGAGLGGAFGGVEAGLAARRAARAPLPEAPLPQQPEIPLSSVVPEAQPYMPPRGPQASEDELLMQLLNRETPEQVLARRGVTGWTPETPQPHGVRGIYEDPMGQNRFNEEQAATALAMGEQPPLGKYGTYDLAPDLVRDQTIENIRRNAIQMRPEFNELGLAERMIEQAQERINLRGHDPLYPGNTPKPLSARDVDLFIRSGSTDPNKVKQFLFQERAKAEGVVPTRTVTAGANLLGGGIPERGFWKSLVSTSDPTMPSYQNKGMMLLRSIGQNSSKAVASLGQSGAQLVDSVRRVYDNFEMQMAQYLDGPQGVVHLANRLKLTPKERTNLFDFMEGAAPALNERVSQVAQVMKAQRLAIDGRASGLLEIRNMATNEVIPWQPRANYMPHFTDFDALRKDRGRRVQAISEIQAQESSRRGQAVSREEAERILNRMQKNSRQEYGHLEVARNPYSLTDFERDGVKAWSRYVEGALKRINEAEVFGRRNEHASQLINQIGEETGDDLSQWMARNYIERVMGRATTDNPLLQAISGPIRSLQVGLKLGQAVIANTSQSTLTGLVTGYGNLFRGMGSLIREGGEFSRLAGATIEQTMRDITEATGSGKFGSAVLKLTGFSKVEQFNRMLAANAGREFARDMAHRITSATGSAAETYKRHLRKMGIEPMDVLARGGKLTPEEEIRAARSVIERTQFKVRAQELPLFWSGPLGKLVTQFSSFGFKAAKAINDEVVGEARKGNYMPLVRFALAFPLVGEIVADVQSVAKGGKERPENIVARLAENYAAVGTFGLFYDAFRSAQYGEVGVLRRMVGPTVSDIAQTGAGLYEAGEYVASGGQTRTGKDMTPPKMIARQLAQNIPVVGPTLRPTLFPPQEKRN